MIRGARVQLNGWQHVAVSLGSAVGALLDPRRANLIAVLGETTGKPASERTNNLQWTLASVPLIKTLQLALSFLFWYSCFYSQVCSLWMSFGVYITGVLFQTASFVSFLLTAHGYCIMCEHLLLRERRRTTALGCVFYLTIVGYRAFVPYFTVPFMMGMQKNSL